MIKNKVLNILVILFTLTLVSCVDAGSGGKRKTSSASGSTSSPSDTGSTPQALDTYWYYNGQEITGTMSINQDIQTVAYLRGTTIHNFLELNDNYTKQYCLVASFNDGALTKNTMNVRAVPIVITNFATNSIERLLRVDFINDAVNSSMCNGAVDVLDANGVVDPVQIPNPGSSPADMCATCTAPFVSKNISLYTYQSLMISNGTINSPSVTGLDALNVLINPANTSTNPVGSCTNTECNAKGFDCCLEGQCVNDTAVRPDVSTSSTEYIQAEAEVALDPLNFLKWPEVYFICPNIVHPTPTPTTPPSPIPAADALFQGLLKEYNCLEGGKLATPDYTACETTFDLAAYDIIKNNVWDKCGCEATGALRNIKCPDYGLKSVKDINDNIIEILCDVPPAPSGPTPSQYLNEAVPVRSVPHRFFDTTGVVWDDITKISDPTVIQEGQQFTYTDTISKSDPTTTQFSMNAILGAMSVTLSDAMPAKTLDLEFDQTYVISISSGFYTPCPQCADDAWFATFKSKPSSYNGTGLQSVGYTTSRSEYGNNTTIGNYEDTIFGRACWIPPTMIPFTHEKSLDLIAQRRNRLTAQSALYVNGYQRDWYGFNQGALIGSFNGVNWFAIGKGRRVTSTSTKLFLAINASFADLSDKTDFLVNVVTDTGSATASDFDYDPNLALTDARQNQGGSCQENHQCAVDSDCIKKLGWEYTCADVNQHKSKWPNFDINGDEIVNEEVVSLAFGNIIFGTQPAVSPKRCVYRGAGAVCSVSRTDLGTASKLFQCAPNFYCAKLDETEFNIEVIRSPNQLSNILFGQEADVLGRPRYYLGGATTFSLETNLVTNADGTQTYDASAAPIKTASDQIKHNIAGYFSDNELDTRLGDVGICRPGKDIAQASQESMQGNKDSSGRTDYINQISSCDSTLTTGFSRVKACPVLDVDGDYIDNTSADFAVFAQEQNMCGASSISTINSTQKSVFFEIEAETLSVITNLIEPKIVADACLRKAGAACQTDLECGPGRLHSQQALFYDQSHFGNTEAEHKFWQEELICSQAQKQPNFTDPDYASYDVTKNNCCREVGKEITMFTQGPDSIIPSNTSSNLGGDPTKYLTTTRYPQNGPSAEGRYSRYSIVTAQNHGLFPGAINAFISGNTPVFQAPIVAASEAPAAYQWKTIDETAQRTCCGRGWVRKFADGTNDWSNRNRLSISPTEFSCLNTRSKLQFTTSPQADLAVRTQNYFGEFSKVCQSPADNGGCIQAPITKSSAFEVLEPTDDATTTFVLSTLPDEDPSGGTLLQVNGLSSDVPYMPTPLRHVANLSSEGPFNYFHNSDFHLAIRVIVPAYISVVDDTGLGTAITPTGVNVVKMTDSVETSNYTLTYTGTCAGAQGINEWCYRLVNGKVVIDARVSENSDSTTDVDPTNNFSYAGLEITFENQNKIAANPENDPMIAGNDLYYLTKLGRLELLGIPQIVYEPLYCNSDKEQLIGGIYKQTTRTTFNAASFEYDNASNPNGRDINEIYGSAAPALSEANPNPRVVNGTEIDQTTIWSDNEFMCCKNLGEETDDPGLCCSGFAPAPSGGGTGSAVPARTCKLPPGTNLNVYFNKFVSGDGMGSTQPGGGLEDTDFVPETGEVKLESASYNKIKALGVAYCDSATTRGGAAFGYFFAEPNTGNYFQNGALDDSKMWSINDSNLDYDDANDTGFVRFLDGFRWNHHQYCN
ncbi:hypothetical protein A9Q84_02745 [Halobacteriovorax marinus]|uniref:Lipoprotein n=1 Tax=Halobacteriovorax marinus TaxID=97084 RepID=A0A1Y5FJC9_9BACT|nr:hypothetical protein A9Q84_02745 [Halobacteriovorax marinus]